MVANQVQHPAPHGGVVDVVIDTQHQQGFALCHRISIILPPCRFLHSWAGCCALWRVRQLFKEIVHGHIERVGQLIQAASANAVSTTLVLLDLLECQIKHICQAFLAVAKQCAPLADTLANMNVDICRFPTRLALLAPLWLFFFDIFYQN